MVLLAILLFVVMDSFGDLVPVNSLLAKYSVPERYRIILRESFIALVVLIAAVCDEKVVLIVWS